MVALDTAFTSSGSVPTAQAPHTGLIVLFALAASAALAAASFATGDDGDRWRDAAEIVSRFSMLLFVAAMVVEPLSRIIRIQGTKAAARERGSLMLAFATAAIVSLVCVVAPSQLGADKMALPAFVYAAVTGGILIVMLFSAHPATKKLLGGPAWRAMQRIATSYFWLVFTLTALDHIVGPNQTDRWWGISLLLLAGAVLVRFADAFLSKLRGAGMTEKAA
jgi:hypothetical protein